MTLLSVSNLPTQFVPFSVNPERQLQLKVPGTFLHLALGSQAVSLHSSISKLTLREDMSEVTHDYKDSCN